jgi:uncharacterized protein YbjT (DUF2867 family)
MIAVTGATGHLGRLVIAALLKKVPASGIVAAVRNVDKRHLRDVVSEIDFRDEERCDGCS